MKDLTLVVARTKSGGIENNGNLPWHPKALRADMCWFKTLTISTFSIEEDGSPRLVPAPKNIVFLRRKTWDSLSEKHRPLERRRNVVLSRERKDQTDNPSFIADFDAFLVQDVANDPSSISFVIGRSKLYEAALRSGRVKFVFETEVCTTRDSEIVSDT